MGVRHGWLTPVVTRYVRWVTQRVVAQDIAILNSQGERIRRYGRREFHNVTADLPAAWLQRAYRGHLDGRYHSEPLRTRQTTYKQEGRCHESAWQPERAHGAPKDAGAGCRV